MVRASKFESEVRKRCLQSAGVVVNGVSDYGVRARCLMSCAKGVEFDADLCNGTVRALQRDSWAGAVQRTCNSVIEYFVWVRDARGQSGVEQA